MDTWAELVAAASAASRVSPELPLAGGLVMLSPWQSFHWRCGSWGRLMLSSGEETGRHALGRVPCHLLRAQMSSWSEREAQSQCCGKAGCLPLRK